MKKKSLIDLWLTPGGWDLLDEFWRERVVNILQDLSDLPHMKYAYAVGQNGVKLTHTIGPGRRDITDEGSNPLMFYHLARIVEDYLQNIYHGAPAHVTVELEDEMIFVGSTGTLILVATFDGRASRGFVGMKLTKRISHLRGLFRASQKPQEQKPQI